MVSEIAGSGRGFAGRVVGLSVAFLLGLSTFTITAQAATHEKNSNLRNKEAAVQPAPSAKLAASAAAAKFFKLPLSFEAIQGQTDSGVKFRARGSGYGIYLTANDAVLALRGPSPGGQQNVLRLKLDGANPAPRVSALEKLPTVVNYLIGKDPKKWRTGIPTYAKVKYESVYPGVDLVYYGNQRQLEYDFVLAPGVTPDRIKLKIGGTEKLEVDGEGNLLLRLAGGEVRFLKPHIYQMVKGVQREIEGGYVLRGEREVAFEVGKYNKLLALVIDPSITYQLRSTYLGGTGSDAGNAIALNDGIGPVMVGTTSSGDLADVLGSPDNDPPDPGSYADTLGGTGNMSDVFIAKLNASLDSLLFWTYFGGEGAEYGNGVALDGDHNIYITGSTTSEDFPTLTTVQGTCASCSNTLPDAFITKFNSDADTLIYSTYLGGNGLDVGKGIAVDAAGEAFVVGQTQQTSPTLGTAGVFQPNFGGGSTDAFVAKLSGPGNTLTFTYLGGSGEDSGAGIALAGADSTVGVLVTGSTSSPGGFPTTNGAQTSNAGFADAFVTELDGALKTVSYSTYLGGSGPDEGLAIAALGSIDSLSRAYITGSTASSGFPTTDGAYQTTKGYGDDAFVAEIDTSQTGAASLIYSTFLGGNGNDRGTGIGLDTHISIDDQPQVIATVVGITSSSSFPQVLPSLNDGSWNDPAGCLIGGAGDTSDAFVAKLKNDGSDLIYSSCLGGWNADGANGIAVDGSGNVFLTGNTASPHNSPTHEGRFPGVGGDRYQEHYEGNTDAFLSWVPISPDVALSILHPAKLDFGLWYTQNAPGKTLPVTVSNIGDGNVTIFGYGFNSGNDYSVPTVPTGAGGSCTTLPGGILPPQATCVYNILYSPTYPAGPGDPDTRTDTFQINHNGPHRHHVHLTGNAKNPPIVIATPNPQNFTDQRVHTTSDWAIVTVQNNIPPPDAPGDSLIISAFTLEDTANFDLDLTKGGTPCGAVPKTLARAAFCTYGVRIHPTTTGPISSQVTIVSNDPVNDEYAAEISGNGIAPIAVITPDPASFPSTLVGTSSGNRTLTITNDPAATAQLITSNWAVSGANPDDFVDQNSGSCAKAPAATVLNAGASCTIIWKFSPTAGGARSATFTLTDATGTPVDTWTSHFNGFALAPTVAFLPASPPGLVFADQKVNLTSSPASTVTVTNTGDGDLKITAWGVTQPAVGADDFSVSIPASDPGYCKTGFPITIVPAASCNFSATFKPNAHGARTGSLDITANDTIPPSIKHAILSGNGVWPEATTTPPGPYPVVHDFGNMNRGHASVAWPITLENTGELPLIINSISIGGGNATDFDWTEDCPGTLPAGATCTINPYFDPDGATALGLKTTTLTITDYHHDNFVTVPNTQTFTLTGTATTPAIALFSTVTYPDTIVGDTSHSTGTPTLTLRNPGGTNVGPLTITAFGLTTGTQFGPLSNTCGTLPVVLQPPPGTPSSCDVNIPFSPTSTGVKNDTFSVTDDALGLTQTAPLTGKGIQPVDSLSLTSLAFDPQVVNTQSTGQTVTLTNVGDAPLTIDHFVVTGDFLLNGGTTCLAHTPIAISGTCVLSAAFKPLARGAHTGLVRLYDNAAPASPHQIDLSGTGIGPVIAPIAGLTFPTSQRVGTPSSTLPVTVINTGDAPLHFTAALGVTGDFAIDAGTTTCLVGTPVNGAGGSCTIYITFTPTNSGTRPGSLTITSDAPSNPNVVSLSGTGISPIAQLSAGLLPFGNQRQGTTGSQLVLSVINAGTDSMTASWALSGTNAADFLPQTPVPGTPCIDGGTLAAGTSCALAYAFHPTTAALETAIFTLTTNVPPPGTAVLTATLNGTGIYPAVTIAPSSLAFDPQVVGTTSDAQTVTLTNSGTDTLNISSITLGGTNANQFATTTCGATLAVGGHCTIDVTFHPTSMNGKSASLVIADDVPYPSGGTQSVSLTGTGTAPGVGLAPASLTFTDQLVGTTSAQQTVTVTNTGTSPLTVSAVAASGNFAVTNGCTSAVAAGGTCTIWVTFTPTTTGTRTGTLTITDDAGTVPGTTQTVGLTGTGIAPVASLTPSPIDFGSVNMNTTSAASTATLANTGGAIMHITAVGISGDYAFASGGTCTAAPFTLAADASCTFKITFTPTALGTRTGTLSVTDDSMNVAGTIQTVALTGVAQGFTFTVPAGGGSKTVTAGSSATYSLTVNAGGGFSGVVNFTCSTAPSTTITCTVSPTSYTFDATHTSVAVTVTVTTTARAMGAPLTVPRAPLGGLGTLPGQAFLMLLMMLLALSALRRRRAWMLLAATLLFVAMLAACGAAAPVAAPPAAKPPGTSAGTYSISVTGTGGGTTVTVPLTLIVN